jgi:hypothetical protein
VEAQEQVNSFEDVNYGLRRAAIEIVDIEDYA